MKSYKKVNDYTIESDVESIVEECFGSCNKNNDTYVVENPDYNVLEEARVVVTDDTIKLDIEEVPVEEAKNKNRLEEVDDVVQAKNKILRELTGRTVEDRKSDLRESVIDQDVGYQNPL